MRPASDDARQRMDEFFAGIERRAYRIALLATRNREDALDIVQEAMFKLAQRYLERPSAEWPPLFYRILESRIQDWARREKVRRVWRRFTYSASDEPHTDPIDQVAAGPGYAPDVNVSNTRALIDLERALRALPRRQQQAFLLRAWEGLDTAQTAQAMGCSEGSVKTHYSRALETLRGLLEGHVENE